MSIQSASIDKKVTVRTVQKLKGVEPVTMITAYDALFAGIFDGEVEMILVGDSLNMSFFAEPDTLSATMDQMIYHTKAVCKGARLPLIVFDMPFGSYTTPEQALENAVRVYQETCAEAVKIEGGREKAHIVKKLTENGIAVIAHIGLKPQSVRAEGGYRVQGRSEEEAMELMEDALALQEAGAFALLLEGMTSDVARRITEAVEIPTIGIGAGNGTDGQVLVWSDMFGFFEAFKPKFVKRYLEGAELIRQGLRQYREEVKSRAFPDDEHSY
ncbi:3-methyl-2-oxobutanoate hydroxymethyltransferase [Nitratifractor salsuginis]|uniref:3-methyl-2-oxobutanoate hydroxymethyltransferase n=1 Tax=Nitratifractor salsuginis (strain DSM 16511 / JCM 12458 / E9I37-1) TaxID=749222 RepID=E6WZE1_NITSE|nr:3-methyl-2-oxobutanoate hydroxymethyltransferase [Nitratifractor salsuginis]ADV45521.1 ketopantoate hydroxymethyltransferase [Nitratifractor salsuginis DSM 16511]